MFLAQQRTYARPALGPSRKWLAKRVLTRFQDDRRSMEKPSLDQDLGTVLTPEFTSCPPIIVAEAQLRLWLGASEAREIKTAQVLHWI